MTFLIELEKNDQESCWNASWDSFVGVGETPEKAVESLFEFPEFQAALKEAICTSQST